MMITACMQGSDILMMEIYSSSRGDDLMMSCCCRYHEHIGRWISVEHELTLSIAAKRDEGQSSSRLRLETDTACLHPVFLQHFNERVSELVIPYLADERGVAA